MKNNLTSATECAILYSLFLLACLAIAAGICYALGIPRAEAALNNCLAVWSAGTIIMIFFEVRRGGDDDDD